MEKFKGMESCADCICRVCARSVHNDSVNHLMDYDKELGCYACYYCGGEEYNSDTDDCDRFLPDEDTDVSVNNNENIHAEAINELNYIRGIIKEMSNPYGKPDIDFEVGKKLIAVIDSRIDNILNPVEEIQS